MQIKLEDLKKLRTETSAGVSDCRLALEDAGGNYAQAKKLILERSIAKASKKEDKETTQGIIESYVHATSKVGVLVELRCETDFVAKNEEFKKLAHEVALQIVAMNPKDVNELLGSEYIRDASLTIQALIKQTITKMGENIKVAGFYRMELGK